MQAWRFRTRRLYTACGNVEVTVLLQYKGDSEIFRTYFHKKKGYSHAAGIFVNPFAFHWLSPQLFRVHKIIFRKYKTQEICNIHHKIELYFPHFIHWLPTNPYRSQRVGVSACMLSTGLAGVQNPCSGYAVIQCCGIAETTRSAK